MVQAAENSRSMQASGGGAELVEASHALRSKQVAPAVLQRRSVLGHAAQIVPSTACNPRARACQGIHRGVRVNTMLG